MTSTMAMGWQRVLTQRGATITGSFSARSRTISKEADPEPTMMEARRTVSSAAPPRSTSSDLETWSFDRVTRLEDAFRLSRLGETKGFLRLLYSVPEFDL